MTVWLINVLISLILILDQDGLADFDQGALQAWALPDDHREAIYVQAAETACAVELDPVTKVVTIVLCEDESD